MNIFVILSISLFAAAIAFVVASKKQRRPSVWMLICFLCPVFLCYLVQLRNGEKATRELAFRSTIAIILLVIAIATLSPLKPGNGIAPYEEMFFRNASFIWDALGISHYRDGSFFKTPRFTFEIPHGSTLIYYSFIFAAAAAIQAIFLRRGQPYATLLLTIVFFLIGHLISVTAVGVLIVAIDNPDQLNKQTMLLIGSISKSFGMLAVYFTVLAMAYVSSRKQPQLAHNQPKGF